MLHLRTGQTIEFILKTKVKRQAIQYIFQVAGVVMVDLIGPQPEGLCWLWFFFFNSFNLVSLGVLLFLSLTRILLILEVSSSHPNIQSLLVNISKVYSLQFFISFQPMSLS